VITLGIDLSSQAVHTALCVVDWSTGRARLASLTASGVSDEFIVEMMGAADKVGIDVPFGWPIAFADAVWRHSTDGSWPATYEHAENRALRLRRTDLRVRETLGLTPLSVSTDRIALPAMRAAALLSHLADRGPLDGSGLVVEAYPAAALKRWNFASRRYKRKENLDARRLLVRDVLAASAGWLDVEEEQVGMFCSSDDAFDALIAAFVARATGTGLVEPIPAPDRPAALREGWIAIPLAGSFDRLATG
jgi:predicted nuclease with RNAse H fold